MSLDWGRNHQLSFGNGGMPNGPCTLAVDSLMSLILSGISIFGNANCSANHRLIVIYVRGIVKTLSSVEIKSLYSFIILYTYSNWIFWKQGEFPVPGLHMPTVINSMIVIFLPFFTFFHSVNKLKCHRYSAVVNFPRLILKLPLPPLCPPILHSSRNRKEKLMGFQSLCLTSVPLCMRHLEWILAACTVQNHYAYVLQHDTRNPQQFFSPHCIINDVVFPLMCTQQL